MIMRNTINKYIDKYVIIDFKNQNDYEDIYNIMVLITIKGILTDLDIDEDFEDEGYYILNAI